MPSYTPFEEGDALTAANINSRFTTMSTWINAFAGSSVARWALRREHLPSQTFGPGQTVELFPNGFSAEGPAKVGTSPFVKYGNSLAWSSGPAHPLNYQTFSPGIYGTVTNDFGGGWRIPSQAASADKMEVDFTTVIASMATYEFRGFLVRAQFEIHDAVGGRWNPDTSIDGISVPDRDERLSRCVLVGIGFEDGLGARYVVERTVRWNNLRGVFRGTVSTSTLLTDTDLAAGDGQVMKVFGVVASNTWADTTLEDPPDSWEVAIRHYNISILPLRGGVTV